MDDNASASMDQGLVLIGYGCGINLTIREMLVLLHSSFVTR